MRQRQISLRPSILEKLENNEFVQKNVPSTFLRGYVRSYAKFLRIPDAEWAHLTFGEAHKNDLVKMHVRLVQLTNIHLTAVGSAHSQQLFYSPLWE